MRLDKFCIAELSSAFSESGYFDFTAVLFVKEGEDSYRELASIDTSVVVGGIDVTKKILNRSSQIVNEFIINNLGAHSSSEITYSLADIDRYHELLKEKIPLYVRTVPQDGLYVDFEEFRQQKPSAGLVELQNSDPALGLYQRNSAGKLKKIASKNYYAAVVDGQAYINCLGNFYHLFRTDDDYCFTGPAKENASATDVVTLSVLFGGLGVAIAAPTKTTVTYYQKLDFRNGSFIKLERR